MLGTRIFIIFELNKNNNLASYFAAYEITMNYLKSKGLSERMT
jgi:hypothetical protein